MIIMAEWDGFDYGWPITAGRFHKLSIGKG